jgi:D-inositol-3-phosphate glycosyltransferase
MAIPKRIAMITVHTSPLEQPGAGDAGGLNVYVAETSKRLAQQNVEVEILTRKAKPGLPPSVELFPGVNVHHVDSGALEGLDKNDLPATLCNFTAGVLRYGARMPEQHIDLIHSHYWLSGQVGWVARERWLAPLVHSMHTMGKVKNLSLSQDDIPEPNLRIVGEQQLVDTADLIIANTQIEERELIEHYRAEPQKVKVVYPGVDNEHFTPGNKSQARKIYGFAETDLVISFVGRIQPLKGPDILVKAAAQMLKTNPDLANRLKIVICGAPSGTGTKDPAHLQHLATELGISSLITFLPPQDRNQLVQLYRASDLVAVPSYSESFGLVAIEAQACGIPVVAAKVGGLNYAVKDHDSGLLIPDHAINNWAQALSGLILDQSRLAKMSANAIAHAADFTWTKTVEQLLEVYEHAMQISVLAAR